MGKLDIERALGEEFLYWLRKNYPYINIQKGDVALQRIVSWWVDRLGFAPDFSNALEDIEM